MTVVTQGDFGKPRPALVVQSNQFAETATVTVLLLSSTIVDAPLIRITVEPDAVNKLRSTSQIMVDKAVTINRDKLGYSFGLIDDETMLVVNRLLALFLGFA